MKWLKIVIKWKKIQIITKNTDEINQIKVNRNV